MKVSQPYMKTKPLSGKKAKLLQDLKEAMDEVNLHRQGKIKLQSARELLDEL